MTQRVVTPLSAQRDIPFFYGVDPRNAMLVHNLAFTGQVASSDFIGVTDSGLSASHREVSEMRLDELENCDFASIISPRMVEFLTKPALYQSGQTVVNGFGERVDISPGSKRRAIDGRAVELAFEKGRREHAPSAPSRLSCIYVVPATPEGRAAIQKMLGTNVRIVDVHIAAARSIAVTDAGWYDDYCNFANEKYIRNYWCGERHPSESTIEVLVDGVLRISSQAQQAEMKVLAIEMAARQSSRSF